MGFVSVSPPIGYAIHKIDHCPKPDNVEAVIQKINEKYTHVLPLRRFRGAVDGLDVHDNGGGGLAVGIDPVSAKSGFDGLLVEGLGFAEREADGVIVADDGVGVEVTGFDGSAKRLLLGFQRLKLRVDSAKGVGNLSGGEVVEAVHCGPHVLALDCAMNLFYTQ